MVTVDTLLHVLPASIGKVLSIPGAVVFASSLFHEIGGEPHRTRPVGPNTLDAARIHLLEANNKDAIGRAVLHERPGKMQARRARRTRIVGIIDWDARHTKLVEDALS